MSTAYPIFDDDGELIRVVSYAQDQTEIRNLQDQYGQLEKRFKNTNRRSRNLGNRRS
ncbi:hypothetical protein RCO48_37260 [Peribacillus frigoritolerans]|nr:hypothetical protein [Peribacillus frigoritolerans]